MSGRGTGRTFTIDLAIGRPYVIDRPGEGRFVEMIDGFPDESFPERMGELGPPTPSAWPPLLWKHGASLPGHRSIARPIYYDRGNASVVAVLTDTPWRERIADAITAGRLGASLMFSVLPGGTEWLPPGRPSPQNQRGLRVRFITRYLISEISLCDNPANRASRVRWL